jgi:hypothetical protein
MEAGADSIIRSESNNDNNAFSFFGVYLQVKSTLYAYPLLYHCFEAPFSS